MTDMQKIDKNKNHSVLINHDEHEFTKQDLLEAGITPEESEKIITSKAVELIYDLDEETSEAILSFYEIKFHLEDTENPILGESYQYILKGVNALTTKEPNKMHRDLINNSLIDGKGDQKIKKVALDDKVIQDQLCRSLLKNLKTLSLNLKQAYSSDNSDERDFEKNGMFLADAVLLETIRQSGKVDKKTLSEYEHQFQERLKAYKAGAKTIISLWFNTKNESQRTPFHLSVALKILADYTWREESKYIQFRMNNVPAITTNIHESIESTLAPNTEIKNIKKNQHVEMRNNNTILGAIKVPSTTPQVLSAFNGVRKLNTLLGHKILRLIIHQAFELVASGEVGSNAPVLYFERGAREIADMLEMNNNKYITTIQDILFALSAFEYEGSKLTGKLINVTKYKSSNTHREEGYLITVLPPLLPYYTFKDKGLLVALLPTPPLVGANQYHAGQMLYTMKVSSEFCKQSINFAKDGAIKLTKDQRELLAMQSGISRISEKVHNRWLQNDNDCHQFLEQVDTDYYRFGQELDKYNDFYMEQGKKRLNGKYKGEKSAAIQRRNKHGRNSYPLV